MLIFQELINKLTAVKSIDDVSEELSEELMSTAIGTNMTVVLRKGLLEPEEAFLVVRGIALQHFDLLRDSLMSEMDDYDEEFYDEEEDDEDDDPKIFKL
jgi:hypothetical protein